MPQNAFFLRTRNLLISPKTMQRHFLFTLHPLSTVIFATATVLAFVLLRNSNFNFHCYTQRKATPTQKSAWKCAATSHNFFRERLQSAFTLANQLRWIAQYITILAETYNKRHHLNKFNCKESKTYININNSICSSIFCSFYFVKNMCNDIMKMMSHINNDIKNAPMLFSPSLNH